jgi:hypothetical protein
MMKELKKRVAQLQRQLDSLARYSLQQSAAQVRAVRRELDKLARGLDRMARRRTA